MISSIQAAVEREIKSCHYCTFKGDKVVKPCCEAHDIARAVLRTVKYVSNPVAASRLHRTLIHLVERDAAKTYQKELLSEH